MHSARAPSRVGAEAVEATVTAWRHDRGFGFARRHDGQGDVFVHLVAVRKSGLGDSLAAGQRILIEIELDRSGRPRAAAVAPIGKGEDTRLAARMAADALWR